jgi:hypothetical protein
MMFVACGAFDGYGGGGPLGWSKDGKNWYYALTYNTTLELFRVCWSAQLGMFVAAGRIFDDPISGQAGVIAYSYDGLNWTNVTWNSPQTFYSVCWSPQLGVLVAVASDSDAGHTGDIYYSRNGTTWTQANIPATLTNQPLALGWAPKLGLFVLIGASGYILGSDYTFYSSDGINWTVATTQYPFPAYPQSAPSKITWSQELGLFTYSSGYNTGTVGWSSDGKNWDIGAMGDSGYQWPRINGIEWSPQIGVFIGVTMSFNGSGTVGTTGPAEQVYSRDGKTWYRVSGGVGFLNDGGGSQPYTEWKSVAWSPELGLFVIVGYTVDYNPPSSSYYYMGLQQFTTITLQYWRSATTDASSSIYRKSIYDSGAGTYIAVGEAGTYNATWSSDGINWNNPSSYSAVSGNQNTGLATGTSGGVNCTIAVGGRTGYAAAYTTDGGINWYGSDLNGFGVMGGTYWWGVATGGGVTWAVGEDWYSGSANQCSAYWSGPIYNYWIHPMGAFGYCNSLFDIDPYSRWDNIVYLAGSGIFLATASTNGGNTDCAYCPTSGPNQNSWQAMPSLGSLGGYGGPTLLAGDGYSTACAISGGDVYWYTGGSWLYDSFYTFGIAKDLKNGSAMGGGWFILEYGGWVRRNPAGPFNGWPVYNSDLESNIVGYSWTTLAFGPTSTSTVVALRENNDVTVAAYYQTQTIPPYVPQCESSGAQLLPSGNVAFLSPGSSNIVQYNPVNLTISNTNVVSYSSTGMVLAPNGNVFCMPNTTNVKVYNPTSLTVSNIATGTVNFKGGVLLPSGNLVCVPGSQSNIGMINTTSLAFSNLTFFKSSNNVNFSGGTLTPSGKVVFCPANVTNVGILDTFNPIASEFCLSPYFNKF